MIIKPKSQVLFTLILITSLLAGLVAGIGGYTFVYAKGASYMTNDPNACANCHIMQDHFDSWINSSHHSVAVCNDCHTPKGLVGKYSTKAWNGMRHSWAFTSGWFHEPIQITQRNHEITELSCRKCHQDITIAIEGPDSGVNETSCVRCHRDVGHRLR
jgi:cytochrome c nitrite reductase small subunit